MWGGGRSVHGNPIIGPPNLVTSKYSLHKYAVLFYELGLHKLAEKGRNVMSLMINKY